MMTRPPVRVARAVGF